MTIGKKISLYFGSVLIILAISVVYSGTIAINKITYQNMTKILSLQIKNIRNNIQEAYIILDEAGLLEIDSYVSGAKRELQDNFRQFRFGKSGDLFIFSKDKKVVYSKNLSEGEYIDKEYIDEMIGKKEGSIRFVSDGKSHFCVFETFPEWHWIIALSIDEAEMFAQKNAYLKKVFTITLLILIIGGSLTFVLVRHITTPLNRLIDTTADVASRAGDLTQQIEVKTKDEIGLLGKSYNKLMGSLRGIIRQIHDAGLQITTSSEQIKSATKDQATGASEQFSAVSEASTTVQELAATSKQIAESAQMVVKLAKQSLTGMENIRNNTDQEANRILTLGEKSQMIGEVVALIDDIAKQTNILALNASIEAERAGEAGKGFAVVAIEIRELATNVAKSTKQIREIIKDIQDATNASVMATENVGKSVAEGIEFTQKTAESANQIGIATRQQGHAFEQVVKAIQNIHSITNQFVASTQQAESSATELNRLSQELKEVIGTFKLGE